MSDFNSSLPIRTQNNGDAAVKVVDGTTPSQALAVDSSGRVTAKLNDGSGNAVTSQANGAQRALDVGIDVAGVQVDPRAIRALTSADVVTANQGTANTAANGWPVKLTDGTNTTAVKAASTAAIATDPSAVVALSPNSPLPTGTNTIGAVNQGTSPWVTKDQSDGPVAPGTVASFSQLSGGQYNSTPPTLTNTQQAALQLDASGNLKTLTTLPYDTNYGTVGATTLRTAAEVGNATGAANFGNGATGAQTLRTAANLAVAGADVSATNPVPVTVTANVSGTPVQSYNTAAAVASAATSNADYTVTTAKTLSLTRFWASASGKLKIECQVESGVATGTFNTRFVGFNSTATPNIDITVSTPIQVAAGVRVRIIRSNLDTASQDVYSTMEGSES